MAGDTITKTSNISFGSTAYPILPASNCIQWVIIGIIECLAIVILNLITVVLVVKQHQLQRRSRYLIIHLAIIDLLVGGASGPLFIINGMSNPCFHWELSEAFIFIVSIFPVASLVNLAAISLDRFYATFFPFKHRSIKKWVNGAFIAAIWLIASLGETFQLVLILYLKVDRRIRGIVTCKFNAFFLFVICVSYTAVLIKVRLSPSRHHRGATNRERKLTTTLIWVTFASLLSWLPFNVFAILSSFNKAILTWLWADNAAVTLVGANSLANPIVYAIRMPEFRAGVRNILCKVPNRTRPVALPL